MNRENQDLGCLGEQKAAAYLIEKGYRIVDTNVRTPYGEIDLIADYNNVLIFVEVKTRSSSAFGLPEEAITQRKREHMLSSAQAYLQEFDSLDHNWRIDVIAVRKISDQYQIVHFENVITE
ncbi:MAG: YraN family protein [Chloroflexota bacterium]